MSRAPSTRTPEEFMAAWLESCRRGGKRSGESRRADSRRLLVERSLRSDAAAGKYTRHSAARIAQYLGVSDRFVRKIAREIGIAK